MTIDLTSLSYDELLTVYRTLDETLDEIDELAAEAEREINRLGCCRVRGVGPLINRTQLARTLVRAVSREMASRR